MSKLNFICVENVEYNTKSVYVENAIMNIKESDYKILQKITNKFKQVKTVIIILNDEIKSKLKIWEEQINEYLKNDMGTEAVTVLYGNKVYTKASGLVGQEKEEERQLIIKSIWINEKNKPFVQLYYNHAT